ncbi:hypothetical protein L211DRAFT_838500 [Terfezia boudieri ATCC MYA-4762]|uniref:Uncharacterized protein n=1 Tax=Terfezia boudieri ATCC MYA-4762 TaxID=1051890 RepID=A0A3N4M019_9PEZI|nr:hypothetical protein L211DRAFT_838500 [Terfezia boudieri ATCC MYA-4762]
MDFAPYQSSPPETTRKSLTLTRPPSTPSYFKPSSAYTSPPTTRPYSPMPSSTSPPPPSSPPWGTPGRTSPLGRGGYTPGGTESSGFRVNLGGFGSARDVVEQFETSLPLRLDYEAMLAYLLLPPTGAVLLLILEYKSDYVRFHAWQGALLFSALAMVHFLVSFSRWLSWGLLGVDVGLMGWLSWRAYRDADTLDRCEVPWFGKLASRILDEE